MKADLSYRVGDLFTSFYPDTPQGVVAWRELADFTDGTGKVLSIELPQLIHSLKSAGYTVAEMPEQKLTKEEIDELVNELSEFDA